MKIANKESHSAFLFILFFFFFSLGQAQTPSSDFVSKVPKFSFGATLQEQEIQLKDNPLMKRMIESRKRLSADKYRPVFHYVNPEGNLNDPNGLCYWNGYWHLFYQAYPP